jgi:CHAT domain-containing protein
MERLNTETGRDFNQYRNLLLKTEPLSQDLRRRQLGRDETVINYFLSGPDQSGRRELYIFVTSRKSISFRKIGLDSLFAEKAGIIKRSCSDPAGNDYAGLTSSLSYMYRQLIKPVEGFITGRRLIILPDEEISGLPFDAFLLEDPLPGQTDFGTLKYLISKYSVSFNYSSSLVFSNPFPETHSRKVIAFAPDYGGNSSYLPDRPELRGTQSEIKSIYRWFSGRSYTGPLATETNFRLEMQKPAIFHLAMHALSDTSDSRYSSLLFSSGSDLFNDGQLFNYEISLARIRSPMVVLSACNSGTGTLYHSEGLMSIARGFLLAGASSVIRTSWEVNDEVSASIIGEYYRFLKQGKHKDEALRMAKLRYMKKSPPSYSNPYFWAAYEVLGSTGPVKSPPTAVELIICLIVITAVPAVILYLRRRRIFSERPL